MRKLFAALMCLCLFASVGFAASVMDKEVVVIGTESTYPPYESIDTDGKLIGFDVEMMEAIADVLGKKIEWVDMPFDSLIPALLAGKIDIVAAGMSATPERAKRVTFSENYEISLSAFVSVVGSPLNTLESLEGKVIAVQLGTVQETFSMTIPKANVKTFQKFDDCLREVMVGRADASLMELPVAKEYIVQKDFAGKVDITFIQEITGTGKALAMPKDDEKFAGAVNAALATLEANGKMEELRVKWFSK